MKAELLGKLLDAGFSKEEIIQLTQDETAKPMDPEAAQVPAAEQDPDPAAAQDPAADEGKPADPAAAPGNDSPDFDKLNDKITGIEQNISALMKAVQLANLKNDSFGNMPDSLETQTDKIMGSIIRPELERKDD